MNADFVSHFPVPLPLHEIRDVDRDAVSAKYYPSKVGLDSRRFILASIIFPCDLRRRPRRERRGCRLSSDDTLERNQGSVPGSFRRKPWGRIPFAFRFGILVPGRQGGRWTHSSRRGGCGSWNDRRRIRHRHLGRRFGGEGPGPYTWWTYRGQAYDNDAGWRIDYQLASADLAALAKDATVDRSMAYADRWSDHAPVTVTYDL